MRILVFIVFLWPGYLLAQCYPPVRTSNLYGVIPRFIHLYNNGDCVVKDIRDTTICVKVAPRTFGQLAYYSYSTPYGQNVGVSIAQFNSACQQIATDNQIYPSTDTTIVCYTIAAELIDNFCPYIYRFVTLSVDWCGFSCSYGEGRLQVDWATCGNANTDRFEVLVSQDAQTWKKLSEVAPKFASSSGVSTYTFASLFSIPGQFYTCVREIDFNGAEAYSNICSFTGVMSGSLLQGYDLAGRQVPSNYLWSVR